jgi:hypothetical protein
LAENKKKIVVDVKANLHSVDVRDLGVECEIATNGAFNGTPVGSSDRKFIHQAFDAFDTEAMTTL